MRYQVQENCLTIYLPKEVDHHNAESMKKEADTIIAVSYTHLDVYKRQSHAL